MTVKPIPDGFHAVTPYLTVRGAAKVIEFLKKTFGAETVFEPMKRPDGLIMHAELKIGDSRDTHKEDVAPQELAKRAEAFFKQQKERAA
jgi:PhnB protein